MQCSKLLGFSVLKMAIHYTMSVYVSLDFPSNIYGSDYLNLQRVYNLILHYMLTLKTLLSSSIQLSIIRLAWSRTKLKETLTSPFQRCGRKIIFPMLVLPLDWLMAEWRHPAQAHKSPSFRHGWSVVGMHTELYMHVLNHCKYMTSLK